MGQDYFDRTPGDADPRWTDPGQHDDDDDGAPVASSGFPRLAPRTFDEEDDAPAPESDSWAPVPFAGDWAPDPQEVPVMEQLPAAQAYGPPPAYHQPAEPDSAPPHSPPGAGDAGPRDATGPYETGRTRAGAPPLRASHGYQADEYDEYQADEPGWVPPGPPEVVPPVAGPTLQARPLPAPPLSAPPFFAVDEDDDPDIDPGPVSETSDLLTADWLLHGRRAQPAPGWRRTVYRATGGLVRIGESAAELRRQELVNRAHTPVAAGHHRVAVMSLKGGVGKTTTAVGLGATLASLRGDRVIAIDANPDRGTLSDKVRLETGATVRDLLNERARIRRYADVRQFTSQAPSRLEILASDRDPGVSIEFSADDYLEVSRVLEHFYSIAITDCGTGLLHSAMSGILELADHIVLVSSPSVDGARSASATLDWLEAHRYGDLVHGAVVVLSTIRPRSRSMVDLDRLEAHFAARCRDVIRIPYDPHLEEGAEVELDLLSAATRDAYLSLAASVGDGFAAPRAAQVRPWTSLP